MFKTMTLALAGLGLTLAACGGGKVEELADEAGGRAAKQADSAVEEIPAVEPVDEPIAEPVVKPVDDEPTEASEGSSTDFVLAATDAGMPDDLNDVGDHFTAIGRYVEDFDFPAAENEARAAQALLQDMHTEALTLPGAGSRNGEATIEAFDVCYWAMDTVADAMGDVNISAVEASTAAMEDCLDAVEHATATIPG